ncbi:MAG: hypothetical protein AB7O65_11440 [Candidatus Korobacteraceae bacterium]
MQLCAHIKTDGRRCGSPALRDRTLCHFHHNYGQPRQLPRGKNRRSGPTIELPVLEDANSVQVALMQIMGGLIDGNIDDRKAGLLLWALQIASANSKRVKFEDHNAVIRSFMHQSALEREIRHLAPTQQTPPPVK